MIRLAAGLLIGAIVAVGLGMGPAPDSATPAYRDPQPIDTAALPLELEELTWTEVRALVEAGYRTVLIPTAGTEQNGPHMILGKHRHVVEHTARDIARALGKTLVAPVMTYVPEGDIARRTGHMPYPGTISIPEPTFEAVLEATARSLASHGFRHICFVGDSGGNQASQARVARKLNDAWRGSPRRALQVDHYYARNGQIEWLEHEGERRAQIGSHAGIRDTSELLAVHPQGVRQARARAGQAPGMAGSGVNGDPTRASAARGKALLQLKVDAAVKQIRAELGSALNAE